MRAPFKRPSFVASLLARSGGARGTGIALKMLRWGITEKRLKKKRGGVRRGERWGAAGRSLPPAACQPLPVCRAEAVLQRRAAATRRLRAEGAGVALPHGQLAASGAAWGLGGQEATRGCLSLLENTREIETEWLVCYIGCRLLECSSGMRHTERLLLHLQREMNLKIKSFGGSRLIMTSPLSKHECIKFRSKTWEPRCTNPSDHSLLCGSLHGLPWPQHVT